MLKKVQKLEIYILKMEIKKISKKIQPAPSLILVLAKEPYAGNIWKKLPISKTYYRND